MANTVWMKIKGVVNQYLKFGFKGPHVEKDPLIDNQLNVFANNGIDVGIVHVDKVKTVYIELSDTDVVQKTTITMQTGAAGDLLFQMPNTDGNDGDVLATDGDGLLSWRNAGGHADLTTHDYDLAFGTSSPLNLLNMLAAHRIAKVIVDVTQAFDGAAATVCVGVAGTTDKFVATGDVDLTNIGTYSIDVEIIQAGAAQMIATYSADGSTAGAAKIIVWSSEPD